jgi:hypothetical protein
MSKLDLIVESANNELTYIYSVIEYERGKLEGYLEHTDMSEYETERLVCFGDAVRSELELRADCSNALLYFTKKELVGILVNTQNVIATEEDIFFDLTENQNAMLILDDRFKVTKICNKYNGEFRTIIEFGKEKYLCFRSGYSDNIYAITFPSNMNDEYKFLTIEHDPRLNYKLHDNIEV